MNKAMGAWMGIFILALGCARSDTADNGVATKATSADSSFLLQAAPNDAVPVGVARGNVDDGDAVSLIGIIGGSKEPFVDGLAAFTIVDPNVPYCAREEGCPTPWDYCCSQDQVVDNIAAVKLVDESGRPVAQSARDLLGVKELATVVVVGVAKRDDQGNLSIAANKVFVQPSH